MHYCCSPWGSSQTSTVRLHVVKWAVCNSVKRYVLGVFGCLFYTYEASGALNTWKQRALVNAEVTRKSLFLTTMTSFTSDWRLTRQFFPTPTLDKVLKNFRQTHKAQIQVPTCSSLQSACQMPKKNRKQTRNHITQKNNINTIKTSK